MNVKPKRKMSSPSCFLRNASSPSLSSSMCSSSANTLSRANMLKPRMPAPRAENMARFLMTALVSRMIMGRRCLPRNSPMMRLKTLLCRALVSRSR